MKLKKYIKSLLFRSIISVLLLFVISLVLCNEKYYDKLSKWIFTSNIDFSYIKSKTSYILGKMNGNKTKFISGNKLNYKKIEKYKDGYKINTDESYVLTSLKSGVVTFVGNMNDLGKTIIIETDKGINLWFSHIENISVNVYDYVLEGVVLGSVVDDYFYLIIEDNGKYLSYEEYI